MNHKPIKAVLLDAGNTILGLDYRIMAEILAPGNNDLSPHAVERAECRARATVAPLLARRRSMSLEDTFMQFTRAIAEPLGLDPEDKGPRHLVELMLTTEGMDRTWCVPMAGAKTTMQHLHDLGLKLAMVSNGDGHGPRRVEEAGLADHFEVMLDSGVVGVEKPDPRIFHMALEHLGLTADEAIHVGDFFEVDILGAREAGLREAILIDPYNDRPELDCHRIKGINELPELMINLGLIAPPTSV